MSQNLQKFAKFQEFQLDNLVDFEKCCKTHIFLQNSVPIEPKTSNILPKFCQKLATTLREPQRGLRRVRLREDVREPEPEAGDGGLGVQRPVVPAGGRHRELHRSIGQT